MKIKNMCARGINACEHIFWHVRTHFRYDPHVCTFLLRSMRTYIWLESTRKYIPISRMSPNHVQSGRSPGFIFSKKITLNYSQFLTKNFDFFGTPSWECFYIFLARYLSLKERKRIRAFLWKNEPRRTSALHMIWWHSANRDVLPGRFQPYVYFC